MTNRSFSRSLLRVLRWAITFAALVGLLLVTCVFAQVPVVLSPVPKLQFLDANGKPLAFGCVFSYQTLSTTPLATYTDYTGAVQNANPLILTSGGFVGTGGMWLQAGLAYRLVVKSAGGSACSLGSTISTVDGIGGGTTTLTTIVPYASTVTFVDAAQNQLFTLTLTGNATSNPLTATGIIPPGIVTWEITQDNAGGHTFSWPANTIGGATICPTANCTTQQSFIWNGTNAIAIGAATYSVGPAIAAPSIFDYALSASSAVCTDANKQLSSTCNSILGITVNGQVINPGGTGNVNAGAAAHSVAVNEGAGAAIAGVTLSNDQALMGSTGADPIATSIPDCPNGNLAYSTSTHLPTCVTTMKAASITSIGGDTTIGSGADGTWITKSVTMPSSGCPCRAFVSYTAFYTNTNSGSFETWIDDGTNQFATSQENQTGGVGGGASSGISASSFSTGTYANSAVITFSGKGHATSTGSMTVTSNARPGPQTSWLNVVVFTSN